MQQILPRVGCHLDAEVGKARGKVGVSDDAIPVGIHTQKALFPQLAHEHWVALERCLCKHGVRDHSDSARTVRCPCALTVTTRLGMLLAHSRSLQRVCEQAAQ